MKTKLQKIKNWCSSNNVEIFNGEIDNEIHQINWREENKTNENSLDSFLEFVTKLKPRFVILNYDTFEYSILENSIKSTFNELKESNSNDELQRFKSLNELIKTKDGQIYFIELSFAENGFVFSFKEFAEWSEEYSEFNEIQEEYSGMELLSDRNIINNETLKIAKELSKFELFAKAKNKPQRELAASIFFKDKKLNKKILYNISSIIEYADSISKMDIEEFID